MNKLDEIGAKHTDGYGYDGGESVMPLADALIDMALLIRAVRQLGAWRKWLDTGAFDAPPDIDPDVMELLEGSE